MLHFTFAPLPVARQGTKDEFYHNNVTGEKITLGRRPGGRSAGLAAIAIPRLEARYMMAGEWTGEGRQKT
jgi:hypothetical protein